MLRILLVIVSIASAARAEDMKEYPFTVRFLEPDTRKHACTGALISPSSVLTSAFCLEGSKTEKCVAGDVSPLAKPKKPVFQVRDIKTRIYHPEAKKGSDYDLNHAIAIAILNKGFRLNNKLKTITMPSQEVTYNDMVLTVAGDGPDAMEVKLTAGTMSQCSRSMLKSAICGNRVVGLLYQTRFGTGLAHIKSNVLYGILVGETVEKYEVFTSVYAHRDWISKAMNKVNDKLKARSNTGENTAVSQLYNNQRIKLLILFLMGKFLFIICPF